MIIAVEAYIRRTRTSLQSLLLEPKVITGLRMAAYFLAGFGFSAAGLCHLPQPLVLGLICACSGWPALLVAAGGSLGYFLFWGSAGGQGIAWALTGLIASHTTRRWRLNRQTPLLLPALAGLTVSALGVVFQAWLGDQTPVILYLLRVAMGTVSCWVFSRVLQGRDPVMEWLGWGFAALSLAQISLTPWMNLGCVLVGGLVVAGSLPATVVAGLGLDLAGITSVPMTAVVCAGYLVRFLPRYPKWLGAAAASLACFFVMQLSGRVDHALLLPLLLGGVGGLLLPRGGGLAYRRGETGVAQVRLEMASGVLAQTEQLLLEAPEVPVDEDALVVRAAEEACSGCPCRKTCKDSKRISQLTGLVLHKPLLTPEELPIQCRKSGRFLAHLHRSQEQLRSIRANRERQREYRAAVVQQYRFLALYLQDLADQLPRRADTAEPVFTPATLAYGNRPAADNGDRYLAFHGVGCKYYVLLCDGMGTGAGAIQEGRTAAEILKRLLTAGYPAEYALRSLNSLCALRDRAGVVTVDLAELYLDTGRAKLYKWGAAPSYLVTELCVERLGLMGPPPGLSVTDYRESVEQLNLRRGEVLMLVSDGVESSVATACCRAIQGKTPQERSRAIMNSGQLGGPDDATMILIHLEPQKQ